MKTSGKFTQPKSGFKFFLLPIRKVIVVIKEHQNFIFELEIVSDDLI